MEYPSSTQIRTIRDAAAAVRGRRRDLGLNQAELARRSGVSRKWISEFEAGKASAGFGLMLRVLDELGLVLEIAVGSAEENRSTTHPVVNLDDVLAELREPNSGDT